MKDIRSIGYWNTHSYGYSVMVHRNIVKSMIVLLGVLVPIIIPLPLCLYVSSRVKSHIRVSF